MGSNPNEDDLNLLDEVSTRRIEIVDGAGKLIAPIPDQPFGVLSSDLGDAVPDFPPLRLAVQAPSLRTLDTALTTSAACLRLPSMEPVAVAGLEGPGLSIA